MKHAQSLQAKKHDAAGSVPNNCVRTCIANLRCWSEHVNAVSDANPLAHDQSLAQHHFL